MATTRLTFLVSIRPAEVDAVVNDIRRLVLDAVPANESDDVSEATKTVLFRLYQDIKLSVRHSREGL